ncbi:SprT-like protease [Pelagibacter phage Greip EXVC021P]|nr:SprT-like protease [Pelagibacter phage Greip EXVC021P]
MAYTTIKKPSDYFNTITYTGDGSSSRSLTGVNFQPDFIWGKSRSAVRNHHLFDSVRGGNKLIKSNSTDAETVDAGSGDIGSFDSDGFTAISGSSDNNNFNNNSENYVAWNWLGANGTSANTDGDIASTVSANTTSGFSIVSYTGNSTSGATVGHGLGVTPKMVIVKKRSASGFNWVVQHASIFNSSDTIVALDSADAAYTQGVANFNGTAAGSSVFTIGSGGNTNDTGASYIAYCFADKQGFSKFGSYTGNGSTDGTFVYTGFKPAFVMIKKTDSAGNFWHIYDTKRSSSGGSNIIDDVLYPNRSDAEYSGDKLDIVSNGIKFRSGNGDINSSGGNYIYMAFAEQPLVGDNPATAR